MDRNTTREELGKKIEELKPLEVERKTTDIMLQRLFNLSIDMLCVADINDGWFKHINDAFEKTLGYTKEELLKEPFVNLVHPDDRHSRICLETDCYERVGPNDPMCLRRKKCINRIEESYGKCSDHR